MIYQLIAWMIDMTDGIVRRMNTFFGMLSRHGMSNGDIVQSVQDIESPYGCATDPLEEDTKRTPTVSTRTAAPVTKSAAAVATTAVQTAAKTYSSYTYTRCDHEGRKLFVIEGTSRDGTPLNVSVGGGSDSGTHIRTDTKLLVDFASSRMAFDNLQRFTPTGFEALALWIPEQAVKNVLRYRWPDMGVPTFSSDFYRDLVEGVGTGHLVVACHGGHGRTGTALAALRIIYLGESAAAAVSWLRTNYCKSAVESDKQRSYLVALAKECGTHDGEESFTPSKTSFPSSPGTGANTTKKSDLDRLIDDDDDDSYYRHMLERGFGWPE